MSPRSLFSAAAMARPKLQGVRKGTLVSGERDAEVAKSALKHPSVLEVGHAKGYIRPPAHRCRCSLWTVILVFLVLIHLFALITCVVFPPSLIDSFHYSQTPIGISCITMARFSFLASSWVAVLCRVVFLLSSDTSAASPDDYTRHSMQAIQTLNDKWYDVRTGIWDHAWWNSGNAVTTLADFASLRLDEANELNVGGYMRNTFVQAQKTQVKTFKAMSKAGMVTSTYCLDHDEHCMAKREWAGKRGFDDFINEYYDDEGWWALAWIRASDVTGDADYLQAAQDIFKDMQTGTGTPCGGGIFWNKDRKYVNAIANELYLVVAASLANRIPENGEYLDVAESQWEWFKNSGMINSDNLINDGLDSECNNNGLQTWSYNQGVILGGLVELSRATQDPSLLDTAKAIARSAIASLANRAGVLEEVDHCELRPGHCGSDGQQFKGIFVRNLRYLHEAAPEGWLREFLVKNADVIWANDRHGGGDGEEAAELGPAWNGPFVGATGPTQSSALDALVAAIAVA